MATLLYLSSIVLIFSEEGLYSRISHTIPDIAFSCCVILTTILDRASGVKLQQDRLNLPAGVYPLMTVVFGYPKARNVPVPPKFKIEDITFCDTYKQTAAAKVDEWFSLMEAGYRASNFFSSFRAKLSYYRENLGRAERELRDIILGEREKG